MTHVTTTRNTGGDLPPQSDTHEASIEDIEDRPIFEARDTDQESRLDRKARARECK